jgi:2-phospho-L-lactate guanylyltransferase
MSAFAESGAGGLNGAVVEGIAACTERGASGVLIVMGDLPLLEAEDAEAALGALPPRGMVLVPSFDGTGTNVLAVRPADLVRPAFGPTSLARHLGHARADGVVTVVCERPGAALDVDTPDDLARLTEIGPPTTSSQRLLASSSVRASASG